MPRGPPPNHPWSHNGVQKTGRRTIARAASNAYSEQRNHEPQTPGPPDPAGPEQPTTATTARSRPAGRERAPTPAPNPQMTTVSQKNDVRGIRPKYRRPFQKGRGYAPQKPRGSYHLANPSRDVRRAYTASQDQAEE